MFDTFNPRTSSCILSMCDIFWRALSNPVPKHISWNLTDLCSKFLWEVPNWKLWAQEYLMPQENESLNADSQLGSLFENSPQDSKPYLHFLFLIHASTCTSWTHVEASNKDLNLQELVLRSFILPCCFQIQEQTLNYRATKLKFNML